MKDRICYKVVTKDMRSLGLRNNPNRITFTVGEWIRLPKNQVKSGRGDWGGIWVVTTAGEAKGLKRYAEVERRKDRLKNCRIFVTRIGEILYENKSKTRIKTNAVYFEAELIYL